MPVGLLNGNCHAQSVYERVGPKRPGEVDKNTLVTDSASIAQTVGYSFHLTAATKPDTLLEFVHAQ